MMQHPMLAFITYNKANCNTMATHEFEFSIQGASVGTRAAKGEAMGHLNPPRLGILGAPFRAHEASQVSVRRTILYDDSYASRVATQVFSLDTCFSAVHPRMPWCVDALQDAARCTW